MAASVLNAVTSAPFNPIVTGSLLLALLRGPAHLRERLVKLVGGSEERAGKLIRVLKVLFSLGLAGRVSGYLDTLVQRGWRLRRPGSPWSFKSSGGSGEIILVTGGCSGFGLRQLQLFSQRAPNATLVTIDRSPLPAELKALPRLRYYNVDLTDVDSVRDVAETIKREVGDVTVLINNAGIAAPIASVLDLDYASMQRVFAVNVFAHVPLIQAFLPAMLNKKKRGHIVTVASMATWVTVSGISDYCASKAAANAMHDALRFELLERYGPNGAAINTTSIHPTWAATGLTVDWMKKPGIYTSRDEVAGTIVDQVLAGRSGKLTVPGHLGKLVFFVGTPLWVQEIFRFGLDSTTRK